MLLFYSSNFAIKLCCNTFLNKIGFSAEETFQNCGLHKYIIDNINLYILLQIFFPGFFQGTTQSCEVISKNNGNIIRYIKHFYVLT